MGCRTCSRGRGPPVGEQVEEGVPSPRSRSFSATKLLRGLCRLLPLPCAKTIRPVAPSGTTSSPSRATLSTEIECTALSRRSSYLAVGSRCHCSFGSTYCRDEAQAAREELHRSNASTLSSGNTTSVGPRCRTFVAASAPSIQHVFLTAVRYVADGPAEYRSCVQHVEHILFRPKPRNQLLRRWRTYRTSREVSNIS